MHRAKVTRQWVSPRGCQTAKMWRHTLTQQNVCSILRLLGETDLEATAVDLQTAHASNEPIDLLFEGKEPVVRAVYIRLLAALSTIGEYREEPKKQSIHLVRATGFAGAHPRKASLVLNLRLDRALESERIIRREQVSKHRWHNEVKLSAPDEVDDEITSWLRAAYELG